MSSMGFLFRARDLLNCLPFAASMSSSSFTDLLIAAEAPESKTPQSIGHLQPNSARLTHTEREGGGVEGGWWWVCGGGELGFLVRFFV